MGILIQFLSAWFLAAFFSEASHGLEQRHRVIAMGIFALLLVLAINHIVHL